MLLPKMGREDLFWWKENTVAVFVQITKVFDVREEEIDCFRFLATLKNWSYLIFPLVLPLIKLFMDRLNCVPVILHLHHSAT
jgi:hypothetical protein